jgi:hypothetical protein
LHNPQPRSDDRLRDYFESGWEKPHAPTENRGAFMAANGMSLRAGQTIGPLFMASSAGTLDLTGAYLAAAGLALVR